VRVFVALPLPHAAAAALASGLEPLRSQTTGIRWVNASGFHVTLHFFGEADSTQVDELSRALAEPGLRGPAIPARLGGLGQFPPQGSPRALWVSLASGGAEARGVWQAVEKTVAALGWQPDPRGFTPHVTVGRAGRERPPSIDASRFVPSSLDFLFTEIVLFESLPDKGGAVYNPLARAMLDGRGP